MLKILFDADMLAFRASAACEREINWYGDLWTLHADAADAKAAVDDMVQTITDKVLSHYNYTGEYEIVMCFSDKQNYRKKILPTYKLNRVGKRKPVCYQGVVEWVKEQFTTCQIDGLEADDCIGILATTKGTNAIIISGDKDFKTIPGKFYDFLRDTYYENTEEQADYWHLYQTLIGDTSDNYKGCPGIGAVTAKKLLDADPTWKCVLGAFKKKGLSEEEALIQARVARILRASDYDFKARQPIPWQPKEM